ncbi:MAG: DUF2796 domain-containing protein [Ilumatobacter sp.]|nr:DUF2796 domain-containing protein [Ilumatobacter sp.]MDG2040604.1 DUF2796 domain-containing protein [Ilumatobacter sp.]
MQDLRRFLLPVALGALVGLQACGVDDDSANTDASAMTAAGDEVAVDETDHADDDHADDEGSSGLGAHEHGTAEMTVAWIGGDVAVDLISPTFNVFGFEYEPTSDEDLAIQADRTAVLTSPNMIVIDDEAACALADPVGTEVERDGSHSEITVAWLFECENPNGISQIDASGLFDEFPNFEDIDVEWISESEQSSAELTPTETGVTLRG